MRGWTDRRGSTARRAGRTTATLLTTALLALGLVGAGAVVAAPALADEGLHEESRSRFVLAPGATSVAATVTTTLRNDTPDVGATFYYWDGYGIPVPAGAQDVRATSDGAELPVTLSPTEDPDTALAGVRFSPLRYGRTRTVEWTFTVPGEPVRSPGYTRVGEGYATFAVQGWGDPGQVSVEVVLPASMTFDATTDAFQETASGDTVTYTATPSGDEEGVWAVVSARDPDVADRWPFSVGATMLTLEAFPGDREWIDFVTDRVTVGLPVLEELVGHPWPGGLDVIREDVSPQVLGYAWFDPGAAEIVVPEDLDDDLLYHELTHAWLNPDHLTGRWLSEGLTEVVAQRTVERTGGTWDSRQVPDRASDVALPLEEWAEPAGERAEAVDEYGYAASWAAVSALTSGLDDAAFTGVVSAAYEGRSAYDAPDDTSNTGRTDWRRFLDLVETRGGTQDGGDVVRTWVVSPEDAALLDERGPARAVYAVIDEADGAWQPPTGLRGSMTRWQFPQATAAAWALRGAPAQAAAVQEAAADAGLPVPAAVRTAYEEARDAEDYAALADLLPRAVQVVTTVGEAVGTAEADRDPVSALGDALLRVDATADAARQELAAGDLAGADALATTTTQRAAWSTAAGAGALALLAGVVAGAALLVRHRLAVRRSRAARAAAAAAAADEVAAEANAGTVDEIARPKGESLAQG